MKEVACLLEGKEELGFWPEPHFEAVWYKTWFKNIVDSNLEGERARGVDPGGQSPPNENTGGGGKHIVLPPNNFDNLKSTVRHHKTIKFNIKILQNINCGAPFGSATWLKLSLTISDNNMQRGMVFPEEFI